MRLAERNSPVDRLGCARDDEQRLPILLDLRMLMRFAGILDGQIMQAELRLNPLQELIAGLEQADPDDVPRPTRPLARFLDGYVFNSASAAVDARGNDPGFGGPQKAQVLCSVRASTFFIPSLNGYEPTGRWD